MQRDKCLLERGRRGGCRKKATHYLVPLDRDLGKNITWDISPVHSIEFGQWWELCCQRMRGMGVRTLMSMKTWQIILWSSVEGDCKSHKPPLALPAEEAPSPLLIWREERTYQVLSDESFLRCGIIQWVRTEWRLTKVLIQSNAFLHCDLWASQYRMMHEPSSALKGCFHIRLWKEGSFSMPTLNPNLLFFTVHTWLSNKN